MKSYYTDYSLVGWIPDKNGGGRWMYFTNETEYQEAYTEATAS